MINNINVNKLIKDITFLNLTGEDIIDYGLVTLKAIGQTKKECICN